MTRKQFIKAVGREPEKDDLERANCRRAGEPGHQTCGICEHGKPVFEGFNDLIDDKVTGEEPWMLSGICYAAVGARPDGAILIEVCGKVLDMG
jgi:hypothetical protein